MSILKTRYERATDVTYEVEAGNTVQGGRLVKLSSAGQSKTKPRVRHTEADTDKAVGAAAHDGIAGEDVGVTHRGWQQLTAAAAIAFGADVVPSSNGRVEQANASAGEQPYGKALHASPGTLDDNLIWVKVYGTSG